MGVTRDDWRANPNLKNETVRSYEAGLELRAWEVITTQEIEIQEMVFQI